MKNTKQNKISWSNKVKEIMQMSGKSNDTFRNYISHLNRFLDFYDENINIDKLKEEDILLYIKREYLILGKSSSTINVAMCSIKFLFSICFRKELNSKLLPNIKMAKLIPIYLPKCDFIQIFNGEDNLKYKCWLLLAFCSGLRANEIVTLKIENINSNEHKLKVLGKGNKERYTILPDITIKYLRLYCKFNHINQKTGYLFVGISGHEHNDRHCPTFLFSTIKKKYNLPKTITFHSLRHSFATYFLINKGDFFTLQQLMGHTNINTTRRYIHYSRDFNHLEGIKYV